MNQCYLCEFKSNKKSDPKSVGVTAFSVACVTLIHQKPSWFVLGFFFLTIPRGFVQVNPQSQSKKIYSVSPC